MPHLRTLTTSDWPLWRDARLAALTDSPHAFKSRLADWHNAGEARWRARLATPTACNIVALQDGRTLGMASGFPGSDGTCELHSVWVSPDARGRGIGDQLLAAIEKWARQTGATTLKLALYPDNAPALTLYRRNGFVDSAEPGDLLPDGARELVMTKPLH